MTTTDRSEDQGAPDRVGSDGSGSPPFFSARLDELNAKVARGENLTNNERGERQGIVFNHSGKPSGFCVI